MNVSNVKSELREIADPETAHHSQRFFKTGPDEYAEGDQFLGIRVPRIRKTALRFKYLRISETEKSLHSKYHEERLCALIILVNRFKKANPREQKQIYELYLNNTSFINNWDLVDTSAPNILGAYLLAKSKKLWERHIAIISTHHFIKKDDFDDTLKIAEQLLDNQHDLIHKAVGWMLREIGKKDLNKEEIFWDRYVHNMPRTMLRYAIEKFPEQKRKKYLRI